MNEEGLSRHCTFRLRLLQSISGHIPWRLRDLLNTPSGQSYRHCLKYLQHYGFVTLERAECVNRRYVLTRKGEEYLELLILSTEPSRSTGTE